MKSLVLALDNYKQMINKLPKTVLNEHFKDIKDLISSAKKDLKEGNKADLLEALDLLDCVYDTLDCAPEVYGLPDTYRPRAMPNLTDMYRAGGFTEDSLRILAYREITQPAFEGR